MPERTDRELLELAAKAAGFIDDATDESEAYGLHRGSDGTFYITGADGWREWNPLADDGDALRLAMHLGFTVEPGRCWHSPYGPAFGEDVLDGELKSTRRAIVLAAAEIGANMQS